MTTVRPAAVAGSFYPSAPQQLGAAVAGHLSAAPASVKPGVDRPPKMLVVPHAGYVYSGDVAALAYGPLARWRERIRRVVLLGPVHRVAVRGLAAPTVDAFETPLGRVPLDHAALRPLRDLPQLGLNDLPHAHEHSLEVQLPFLQTVLGSGFTLVPLAVGQAGADTVAQVLERLWGGEETLIVVSSDLSHYLPYAQAQAQDQATVQRILHFATDLRGEEACGAAPLNGALLVARRHGLVPRLLGLRNSADAAGTTRADRHRVVGYGAIAFDPPRTQANAQDEAGEGDEHGDARLGRSLLGTARQSIAEVLGLQHASADIDTGHPALPRPGASFVTLHGADGRLRGCIGRLQAVRPLVEDVHANARAAAFHDSRFMPLRTHEWPGLQVEVSVLGQAEPLSLSNEAEAWAALRPGVDGVILEWRHARATFLPQVWQQLPDAGEFLAALKHKAGLAADFWSTEVRLSRYRVRSFADRPLAGVVA
ncbi:MAG: AmmeMemoRadiSam system protein B [Rubrivivax sp.]|nr:AmmeMemoRadiSam system protein B [Rubrivivax sp.]